MKKMEGYIYTIKTLLKKDLKLNEHYEVIGKALAGFIDDKERHYLHEFKNYVYSNLGYTRNKIYKKGEYKLEVRSFNENILEGKKKYIYKDILEFEIVKENKIKFSNFTIKYLKVVNPAVFVKKDKKYWIKEDGKEELIKLFIANSVKKFKKFIDNNINNNYDFIEFIDVLNKYPVKIKYKNISMLGNKFLIRFKDDEYSQIISKLLFFTGIGNKNAVIGGGFANLLKI